MPGPALPGSALPGGTFPGYGPFVAGPPPPYPYKQQIPITINAPLASPPQQFTNVATLIQADMVAVMLFITFPAPQPILPGFGGPGGLPGWGQPPISALMVEGKDYTRAFGRITFASPPPPECKITAQVFARGKQLGGATALRNIAPWSLAVTGAYDGVAVDYQLQTGPTISGNCDGTSALFTVGVSCPRYQVFRNGLLLTAMFDYNAGTTAVVFLPGAVPVPGDTLTFLGYGG
jgi:hypothetical protein